ncbi:MAG TPA: HEPN domain-containing protein [Accumulibacter sp.]|uniref:HEPN domain-containing protein n=1 Tax=Accumulibacter sp. TaxID=2053492 RepID=UPI002C153463|nr:HEPN domain-containing protein [Accumulibacter sp.]HRF74485.1 HEPN domain-containing protein [Accumulibacter sp.]
MTPSLEEALRLLRLAQRDLQTYRILAAHPDASLAATCFHAQQSVEKALKAVLTARRATFPRTHNLEELGLLVTEIGIGLPAPGRDLRRLTPFAVDFRYDEETVGLITTEAAGLLAESVFQWARVLIEATRQ